MFFSFFLVLYISNKLDLHQILELVQQHQNISDPLQDQVIWCNFSILVHNKNIKFLQGPELHSGVVKILNCFQEKLFSEPKSLFLALGHLN